jgi:hypothetical protein
VTFLALNKQNKTWAIMENATPRTIRSRLIGDIEMPDGSFVSSIMQCDDIEKTTRGFMNLDFQFIGSIHSIEGGAL